MDLLEKAKRNRKPPEESMFEDEDIKDNIKEASEIISIRAHSVKTRNCDKMMTLKEYKKHFPQEKQVITPEIIPEPIEHEKFEIQTVESHSHNESLTLEQKKAKIREDIELIKYMVDSVLDKDTDYYRGHITRSGCCKLALAFDISFEVLSIEVEKEYDEKGRVKDIHAYAKARAFRRNRTYVIATGDKSKSEFWSEKKQSWGSYNLHNLRQTAATKACNRAILNAISFGMISADEVSNQDADFDF